jgi:secreted trypsin-like serine protease
MMIPLIFSGDSGNMLMNYVNLNGKIKAVQFGVVASGHSGCGQGVTGFPGIYSDVNYYLDFILDNLEQ